MVQRRAVAVPAGEIAKLVVIIAVAGYCHQHRGDLDAWRLAVAVVIAALPMVLVLMQNDLGTLP